MTLVGRIGVGSAVLALACELPSAGLEPHGDTREAALALEDRFVLKDSTGFDSSLVQLADENGTPRAAFALGLYSAEDGDFAALGDTPARTLLLPPATRVRLCKSEGEDGLGADCKEARNTRTVPRLLQLSKSALDQGIALMEVTAFAMLFPGVDYAGVPEPLGYGVHEAGKGALKIVGNDQTRSVFLPPGVHIKMCAHEPQFTPAYCRDYSESTPNIGYRYVSYAQVTPVVTALDGQNKVNKP
jgi:hypothetical protein